ncbi:alpha/beta hydrolase [Flavobacterium sp. NST-5]|uniref:Alpha/beta hydrolase n=1 Tax=Flavobacterium ichthyis TaxID=2698827 RepID=A0ABW9ZBD7_9FLAO|nr:alpha/beta hydrolase [Flavobacterium ichthyis]NBL66016.1 alpha/beta hydrolase [Flavobacterium ichthyis]
MEKIHVYFMPGMAASSAIFENIKLPENQFEIHLLDWLLPLPQENLKEYAKRISKGVKHENPVLVGVSFGGVLVQEMAEFLKPRKVIIISSVKCNEEFPRRMKFAKKTKAYKIIPTGMMQNVEFLARFSFTNKKFAQRLRLYEKFMNMRDKSYLDWALEQIIFWDRTIPNESVVHIHGDSDEVFPVRYIKNYIAVPGGTHIMIINKYKWLNENLPEIILKKQ